MPGVSFAKLKAQVQTRNFEWDLVNLGDVEYGQAVLEGLLDKVDKAAAKTDQLPPHIVREYGITSYSLGTNLVYRKDKFPNGGPQSWADFWDVKRFPGPRCLFDRSFTCLAFALLADGVPIDKLYPMDLDRAFRKMSEIKPHIKVWWREGSQSQQLIRDGEVDIIAMWSARAVDLIEDKVPLEIVWNGAELYYANLLVPKGDPNAKATWEFCNFVAQAKPQADFAMLLPYGPANPGRARADDGGAAAADAGLAGEREGLVPARCHLDRAAARPDPGTLDPVAHDVTGLRAEPRPASSRQSWIVKRALTRFNYARHDQCYRRGVAMPTMQEDMPATMVRYETEDKVGIITLDRADKLNAINSV